MDNFLEFKRRGMPIVDARRTVYHVGYKGQLPSQGRAYDAWRSILKRCYSETYVTTNPRGFECVVADGWHCFDDFSRWYDANHKEGMYISKDVLTPGNKIYSPEYCRFVPARVHRMFSDYTKPGAALPVGVSRNKKGYQAHLSIDGRIRHFGTYDTLKAAGTVYHYHRCAEILRLAELYRDVLTDEVYDALVQYAESIRPDELPAIKPKYQRHVTLTFEDKLKNLVKLDLENCVTLHPSGKYVVYRSVRNNAQHVGAFEERWRAEAIYRKYKAEAIIKAAQRYHNAGKIDDDTYRSLITSAQNIENPISFY